MNPDFTKDDQIGFTIVRMYKILRSNFLQDSKNTADLFYNSVIIESILLIDFLLQECKVANNYIPAITFTDDIPKRESENQWLSYSDITGLFRYYRNAIGHMENLDRYEIPDNAQSIFLFYQVGTKEVPGIKPMNNYDDDIAIIIGDNVMYVKRHLERAYNEVSEKLFSINRRLSLYKSFINRLSKGKPNSCHSSP